ncbi:hypothetical protein K466DRAFT_568984 [Polyporus arcularius HHB13444]|uniref:Uncharacterized protein n=1 Tax=Polyporus arcularius HHB13444 TaxID=1314778 RepID=A0A5C3NYS7_9APHY|nr:hypothetical protein K466DRAFT_568984 [Polyporus arcularius HHB13444]
MSALLSVPVCPLSSPASCLPCSRSFGLAVSLTCLASASLRMTISSQNELIGVTAMNAAEASITNASQDEEQHIPHDEQGTPPPGEEEHEEEPLPFPDNDDDFCPPSPPASPRLPNAHPVEEEEEEEEEPPYGWYEETGAPREALLEDLRKQQISTSVLDDNVLNRLRNPQRKFSKLSVNRVLRLALRHFIDNGHTEEAYHANRLSTMEHNPNLELPTLEKMRKIVEVPLSCRNSVGSGRRHARRPTASSRSTFPLAMDSQ